MRWELIKLHTSKSGRYWKSLYRCVCGVEREVLDVSVRAKQSKSCGCLQREAAKTQGLKNKTHGKSQSTEYYSWGAMWDRCTDPKNKRYVDYGGRGIAVCEEWKLFKNFYADMGPKPLGTSLDRINNELGYTASNCRWATPTEQSNNRRRRRWKKRPSA